MTTTDARGRIMGGDPRYGLICACGNLKGWQSRVCRRCYLEELHDEEFWARRRCGCGGPKAINAERCRGCANDLLRGVPCSSGRVQPQDHRWRITRRPKRRAA